MGWIYLGCRERKRRSVGVRPRDVRESESLRDMEILRPKPLGEESAKGPGV